MSYSNPIHSMGVDEFFARAKRAGVDGVIIPDMIPEESIAYSRSATKNGIALIYLVAPTTPKSRIRLIAKETQGFLYAVSLTGVTGVKKAVPAEAARFLKLVKASSRKPVAVGFGLTTPEQVRHVSRFADGVIIGSALIREIGKSKSSGFKGAARFMKLLKGALHAS
jgi:tryptophan synthase alpha chain